MSDYYDPDGRPITIEEWALLFEKRGTDPDTSWWKKTTHLGRVHVSTVWLGMNHGYGDEPPLIYETMVFGGKLDDSQWRYSDREHAFAHHDLVVEEVKLVERYLFPQNEPDLPF